MTRLAALALLVLACAGCSADQLIRWAFRHHPGHVQQEAVEVAWCESRFDPQAVSRGGHVGWFQLSPRFHRWRADELGLAWEDVATIGLPNALVAEHLYSEQGWRPWSCRP